MDTDSPADLDPAAIHKTIATIWNDVLDVPSDGTNSTFFESSGQSISAVRIVARIEDEIGVRVDMGDLFEDPDLETFVASVVAKAETARAR